MDVVNPDVLVWTRESIGLSMKEAAERLGMTGLDLRWLEEGVDSPTLHQLRRMVKVYKRPLAVFLLAKPPKGFDVMKDFRLLPTNQGKPYSPELRDAFRRAWMQHEVAQELAELADDMTLPLLSLSLGPGIDPEAAGEALRAWLGAPVRFENGADISRKDDLNEWINLVEAKGVLVIQVERVALTEMRGCSIGGQPFPIIILNGKDSRRARIFTLLHELVHVLQHSGAVCDLELRGSRVPRVEANARVERFCDHVAAATLMPRQRVLNDRRVSRSSSSTTWTDTEIKQLADEFGVSREAVLLRLVELGYATWDFYFNKRPIFLQAYDVAQDRNRDKKGGPTYYRMKVRNFGRRYISAVIDAYHSQDITGSDLSDYLDMKATQLPRLEAELGTQQQ